MCLYMCVYIYVKHIHILFIFLWASRKGNFWPGSVPSSSGWDSGRASAVMSQGPGPTTYSVQCGDKQAELDTENSFSTFCRWPYLKHVVWKWEIAYKITVEIWATILREIVWNTIVSHWQTSPPNQTRTGLGSPCGPQEIDKEQRNNC